MNSFFIPNTFTEEVTLGPEESNHCIRVLRLKMEDKVLLLDGKGSQFTAAIVDPHPKKCILQIVGKPERLFRRPYHLTIAIAPTKSMDRFEWFLEKSTEIGIDRIVPLICQHSERKDIKTERLEKIIISAMKQSGQGYLPELTNKMTFKELIQQSFSGEKYIAHCIPESKTELQNALSPGKDLLILIGPEGDFDPSEVSLAINHGYVPVSLGDSRLRTETAGIVACHTAWLVNSR